MRLRLAQLALGEFAELVGGTFGKRHVDGSHGDSQRTIPATDETPRKIRSALFRQHEMRYEFAERLWETLLTVRQGVRA